MKSEILISTLIFQFTRTLRQLQPGTGNRFVSRFTWLKLFELGFTSPINSYQISSLVLPSPEGRGRLRLSGSSGVYVWMNQYVLQFHLTHPLLSGIFTCAALSRLRVNGSAGAGLKEEVLLACQAFTLRLSLIRFSLAISSRMGKWSRKRVPDLITFLAKDTFKHETLLPSWRTCRVDFKAQTHLTNLPMRSVRAYTWFHAAGQ